MRASVFIATSLDGYIARRDGRIDWLPAEGDGPSHGFEAFFASVDAVVIGRGTFETVLAMGGWFYGQKPVVVLSSKPEALPLPAGHPVEGMAGAPAELVRRFAARGWNHLYVDGGITIQRFLAAGLIQRLTITHIPVLLGEGIPLFGPLPADLRLAHLATRTFPGGLVQSEYETVAAAR